MKVRLSRLYLPLVIGFLALAVTVQAIDPFFVQALRLIVFDVYQRLAPQPYDPELPVRIVDIDADSLARIGQWPWPRTTMGDLTRRLADGKAAAIAFDIMFAEPDRNSLEVVAARLSPAQAAVLASAVAAEQSNDAAFAAILEQAPSVLAVTLTERGGSASVPDRPGFAILGDDPKPFIPSLSGIDHNLPALEQAASGLGSINWIPNRDQVVRRAPLVLRVGDRIVPSLAAEALRVAQGATTYLLKSSNASGETAFGQSTGLNHIKIGALEIPTDADGALTLKFRARRPEAYIPAWKVLAGDVSEADIAGKIIFVGTSAPGLLDLRATPLDAALPGVEIHAQVVEHILAGRSLTRPDFFAAVEKVLIVTLGLMMAWVLPRLPAGMAALFGLGAIALLNVAAWLLYQYGDLLLDPFYPSLVLLVLTAAITFYIYRQVETQRGEIRSAFGRYLAPVVVEEIIANPGRLELGGEVRELSLMFCDVRNFTSISERLTAHELTHFINQLLTPLSDVIHRHRGTIDKYMGDAIMAFWNAPLDDHDHAVHACRSAVEMVACMDELNEQWRREALSAGRAFNRVSIGIGINTGECCVGNLGSTQRFDYSAIGDDVNVTSRLESLTKLYGLSAVIGERTIAQCPDLKPFELDFIQVKGRARATRIFTLRSLLDVGPAAAALEPAHARFLAAYRAQQWDEAEAAIAAAVAACRAAGVAVLERYYALFTMRIAALRTAGLPADWDGAYALTEK